MTLIYLNAELIPAEFLRGCFRSALPIFMSLVAGQQAALHLERSLLNEVLLNAT